MIATRALVDALVRHDDTVDAGELYAVATTLGMTDQQVRLCVKRLVAEGRFTHEGRGRRAVLRATAATTAEAEFVHFAHRQDQGLQPWDGRWRLVGFAVPETSRAARDSFRDAIGHLGGAPIQGGLYVSPNDWDDLVDAEAARLGVTAGVTRLTSTDLRVGGESDPVRIAALLWPLDEIAGRYADLAALARALLDDLDARSPVELLASAVELTGAFTRAMEPDPLLPPELLPRPWPGTTARELCARGLAAIGDRADPASTIRLFRRYPR
ncbi:putative repressor in the phenylacetic acid catabolism [Longispora fulva]|uniref:Phenylacetic acid degradation operon negative regulatory protein n=1 Tax=Longispora fulva TaxID=619741 RepID=A0A8J7GPX3_9ACTN|nr:PaaX family transcriptional regulator C-terminal domain-containing protein [Longispora fulva]MBG6134731.1 phenylacetic acid degradation operon negative regulatory protein [Longispora fulva]GIG61941.1 putative repressor in the phenylacetic acid catabolism [Longispora fulva]